MVKIGEIMKKYVVTVGPEITIDSVAKIMTNNRIGSVVVMEEQRPISIVTTDDITTVVAKGLDPKKTKIMDLPRKKLITASPDDDLLKVTKTMVKNGIKRMPVLKNGKLEGIISEKEILSVSPELIDILSEKLKARVSMVANPSERISGICERCEAYSDDLRNVAGRWYCEDCR